MKTHQLQGIRGVAALLVAIGHCLGLFRTPAWFVHLKNYSNGHAAVVMFFLLSGFVLTYSLKKAAINSRDFYIKRLFRIYPAWVVGCTISLLYLLFVHYRYPILNGGDWWAARFQAARFRPLYIAASYTGALAFLLPQGWTIFVEVVASLLMPFIAYGVLRRRTLFHAALGLALLLSLTIGSRTYYGLLSYLVDFLLGAWLAAPPLLLIKAVKRTEPWTIVGLISALVVLIAFRNVFPAPGDELSLAAYNSGPLQCVEAICCFWILAVVIHGGRPLRFLNLKPLSWLGEISFSFYLIHVPIMCLLATVISTLKIDTVSLSFVLLFLTIPISLALSTLMYGYVERPGIALGQRVLAKINAAARPGDQLVFDPPASR